MLTEVTMKAKRATAAKAGRSMVISMRLPLQSGQRLKRLAGSRGWTPSEASARLVEEGLRRADFAFIDFRDSSAGRQAYLQGSSLAVWEIVALARSYKNDAAAVAKHLRCSEAKVRAAFNYAASYPEEISSAVADNDSVDLAALSRLLPQVREFVVGHRGE